MSKSNAAFATRGAESLVVKETTNEPLIDLRNVQKAYKTPAGAFLALKGVDLQINRGEFVAVLGNQARGNQR